MPDGCIQDCLACGKCKDSKILDTFLQYNVSDHVSDYSSDNVSKRLEQKTCAGLGIAADIGTTNIVLLLIDLKNAKIITRHSFKNPQYIYGPDVISRIHASNNGSLIEMQRLITESITIGIKTMLQSCNMHLNEQKFHIKKIKKNAGNNVKTDNQIKEIVIAGNTTMIHLLLGIPCDSLGVFPFKPVYSPIDSGFPDKLFGIPVRIIPWFTSFVGGDIMSGILHLLPQKKKCFLLIDLGTNGEMAFYKNGKLTITSTAAGPVFESSAQQGGASEVISELANCVREKKIDETGLLEAETVFTQKQIRDLQLAKSAVRSGLEIILEETGTDKHTVEAIYLAGGIGQAMDISDAVTIGLIPEELSCKATAAGNTSLGGAVRLLLKPLCATEDIKVLSKGFKEINLASHPRFNDLFMENMFFTI